MTGNHIKTDKEIHQRYGTKIYKLTIKEHRNTMERTMQDRRKWTERVKKMAGKGKERRKGKDGM